MPEPLTEPAPLSERFNLSTFTNDLIGDLKALRAGKISVRDARARAELARQVLRAVHYVVTAERYLGDHAHQIPAPAPAKDA